MICGLFFNLLEVTALEIGGAVMGRGVVMAGALRLLILFFEAFWRVLVIVMEAVGTDIA